MDSTAVQAIIDNTSATLALTGTLWVFLGAFITMLCGYLAIKYTLRG